MKIDHVDVTTNQYEGVRLGVLDIDSLRLIYILIL